MRVVQIISSVTFWLALGQWLLLAPAMAGTQRFFDRSSSPMSTVLGVAASLVVAAIVMLGPLWIFDQLPIQGVRRVVYSWGAGIGAIISIMIGVVLKRKHKRAI